MQKFIEKRANKSLVATSLLELTEEKIKKLANYSTLTRGLMYFNEGRIINPIVWDQTIQAEVVGSGLSNYVASVNIKNNEVNTNCNCPSAEHLCKHTIALLYAWIKNRDSFKEITQLESSLGRMRKEELIGLLMEMIKKDPHIISVLNLDTPKKTPENRRYGDHAVLPLEFEIKDYQQLNNLLDKLKGIKETAKNYFKKDEFQNGLKILQVIIQQSVTNYKKRYDVDGLFAEFIEECVYDYSSISSKFSFPQKEVFFNDFIELYLQDTGGFAPSILELILTQCHNQTDYDKLERMLLAKLSDLKEDEQKENIIELLLEVYDKKGDNDRYLEVCKNNLNNWRNCVRLCDKLQQLGKENEAIQWYQKAIEVYEKYPKLILKKNLALLYEKTNNINSALNLYFDVFKEEGELESYKKMKGLFSGLDRWEKIRNNILLFLGKAKKYPLLIELLLYEKDIDSAIKIALLPNQRVYDIKKVAKQAIDKKPTQAIRLFKRLIDYYIGLRRKDDYQMAKEYCQEVKKLYKKLNQEHIWERYIERVKRLNATKRLLLEELEGI
ncbi:MAG: hypothetical protein AB1567_03125 [bacterium]